MKNSAPALKSSITASLNIGIKKNEMSGSYTHKAKEKEKAFQSKEEDLRQICVLFIQHTINKIFLSDLLATSVWVLVLFLICNTEY